MKLLRRDRTEPTQTDEYRDERPPPDEAPEPLPEPEVVQNARAMDATARVPTTLSAIRTRFLVNFNID